MRRSLTMAVACCALAAGIAEARDFPYTAVVVADEAYARSGPGTAYYETLRLNKGDQVLVERHDPGGWYAIAPPAGSFSWVKASEVEKGANGLGTITGQNVEARVGSLKPVSKSFHQVRLSQGAQVKILDERKTETGVWYRIVPPTGELRWIAGRDVAPVDEAAPETPNDETAPASPAPPSRPYPPQAGPESEVSEPDDGASPPNRGQSDRNDDVYENDFTDTSPRETAPAQSESVPEHTSPARRPRPSPTAANPSPEHVEENSTYDPSPGLIAEANRKFIEMIRQEISLWDFTEIRRLFEEARDRATTPGGRTRALERLEHLARYEQIKASHDGFRSALARSRYRDRAVYAAEQRRREELSEREPRYDGTGVLRRAPYQGAGAPRYMLTDPQGNVRYYVVPGVGVDLHDYLGQTVAVYGTLSYRSDLLSQQIAVRQVLPIEPIQRAERTPAERLY